MKMYYNVTENSFTPDFFMCEKNTDVFCVNHMHHYMEVAFVLEGEVVLLKKNKEQFLHKGEMAIVMPYEIHGYETKGKSEMLVIGFQPEYISEYKRMLYGKTFENSVIPISKRMWDYLEEISQTEGDDLFFIKSLLYCVLSEFIRNGRLKENDFFQNDTLGKALEYISSHYLEDITLKSVSLKIGVTSVHLSRILSKESGMNFTRLVNCMRLREAKRLLDETDMSISAIAYESGFGSIRNFNRNFKKYFGCIPGQIKKRTVKMNFLVRNGVVEE